jgi:hypothetical protein
VVVVVGDDTNPDNGRVIVGVDGSDSTEQTLQVAFDAAVARGCPRAYGVSPDFGTSDPGRLADNGEPTRHGYVGKDLGQRPAAASRGAGRSRRRRPG